MSVPQIPDFMTRQDALRWSNQVIWNHPYRYIEVYRRFLRDYIRFNRARAHLGSEPTAWQIRHAGFLMQQVELQELALATIMHYQRRMDKAMMGDKPELPYFESYQLLYEWIHQDRWDEDVRKQIDIVKHFFIVKPYLSREELRMSKARTQLWYTFNENAKLLKQYQVGASTYSGEYPLRRIK